MIVRATSNAAFRDIHAQYALQCLPNRRLALAQAHYVARTNSTPSRVWDDDDTAWRRADTAGITSHPEHIVWTRLKCRRVSNSMSLVKF